MPADVLHLVATGLWLGGLVVLWQAKPPAERGGAVLPSGVRLRCVLVGTGHVPELAAVGQLAGFLDTEYGRLLLLKIAAVVVVLGAAWCPGAGFRIPTGSLRHPVLAETAGAVVVLALTAALVNSEPAPHTRTPRHRPHATPDYNTIAVRHRRRQVEPGP